MINRTIVSALTLVLIVGAFVGGWYFGKSQNDEPQTSDSMNTSGTVNRTPAVQTVANVQNFSLEINESARSKDSQTKIQLTDFQVLDSQYKAVVNVILADGTTSELTLTPSKQFGSQKLIMSVRRAPTACRCSPYPNRTAPRSISGGRRIIVLTSALCTSPRVELL
jgi:hypothetical protein